MKFYRRQRGGATEAFHIPRSAQKTIPIQRIYADGIFQFDNRFTKSWRFSDINYSVASQEDQMEMFLQYCAVLNSLPTEASTKITINNRKLDASAMSGTYLAKREHDHLDRYRQEYNTMLQSKLADGNNLSQEKYMTITAAKKDIEEARSFFRRIEADLIQSFHALSSEVSPLSIKERLSIVHDFFQPLEEFQFDMRQFMQRGADFKDAVCPDTIQFRKSYFESGQQFGRVLFLKDYASYIKDEMITDLTDFSRNLILSIDLLPVSTDEAVKEMQNRILAVETDITRWQRRQNANNNFSAVIPYDLEQMRAETKEFLDDLTSRDQRMIFCLVTIVHMADTLAQLDQDTETLLSIGHKHLCHFAILHYQQEDGLNTVLPYGPRKIHALRTLTTEGAGVLMPFKAQEILDKNGLYYGVNAVSHNLIICDRKKLLNGHGFYLGVSGSGKSFIGKEEIVEVVLDTDDDVIIADPEREYGPLVRALGGEVVQISATSENHINALDMTKEYGDGQNPITLKSEFVMSLCEQAMGTGKIEAKERSIIDRCVANVYRNYTREYAGLPPTLMDFREELLRQPEPEAQSVALAMELFTAGSLNVFAHQSNINMNNRIMCFDINDLGETLMPLGLLVMLDAILNRVIQNRKKGRFTRVYIDEIYLFFSKEYSSSFLYKCWKRFRKYYALITGITQNVEECLASPTARLMLANSEFLVMLNQAATDRKELAQLLSISNTQMGHITNAGAGRGLLRIGGSLVPFINDFPKDTQLYQLMTTKPSEISDGRVNSRKRVI